MRLLHSNDLTFLEIFDQDIPKYPYAILSHRWDSLADEVSYEQFLAKEKVDSHGFAKIISFCDFASSNGYEWVWVDTCCIDKRSSAEFSEAINSMFSWYQRSSICVAYLRDTHSTTDDFAQDEWFSRGWTLQELIAPRTLQFVNSRWNPIGWKHESHIAKAVTLRTGIPQRVLSDQVDIKNISVARRMSWMANRHTTKVEDMAYCLLGIFDVNMPLLYGERWKAFQRLQLLIMEQYEDESIFAWSEQSTDAADSAFHGLLAKRPSQFAHCGNVVAMRTEQDLRANARNVELRGGLLRAAREDGDSQEVFLYQIRCAFTSNHASYLDLYVSDSVLGNETIRPCFIALSLKSRGDLFSRVRARQLPWTLATYQESIVLARQPMQSFRARTSFTIEAIIDRVFGGSTPEAERDGRHEPKTYAMAVSDRSGPQSHTSTPIGDIRNAQPGEMRSPSKMQQPFEKYDYPPVSPWYYVPTSLARVQPSPIWYGTPPVPGAPPMPAAPPAPPIPRPKARSAGSPTRHAVTTFGKVRTLGPQQSRAASSISHSSKRPVVVQAMAPQLNPPMPRVNETSWVEIAPDNMPYGSFGYGNYVGPRTGEVKPGPPQVQALPSQPASVN